MTSAGPVGQVDDQQRPQGGLQGCCRDTKEGETKGNENKEMDTEGNAPDGKAGKTEDVGCVIWCRARRERRRTKAESLKAVEGKSELG